MCGFLGEFSFDSSKLTNRISFDCLLELSKNRGPDNTSVIQDNNYQLGFNRLAILDVSDSGNQPKLSPSKRYAVVFNGEIYNFKQLQKEYQLQNLQSSADTEVLIHLLDKLGIEKTIHLLNGMYAIAIVDRHDKTVTLVRDFAGIKPLYYGISDEGIVFASQFDQIFKHPWHDRTLELRPEIMKEYFGFGFMQAPNTVYSDIFQVCPGELIQFSEEGNLIKKVLIKFSCQVPKNINNKSDKNYNDVLKEIISDQLISDVSLASFLSGGIDSPLITAVAKQVKEDIEAFTFGIDNSKYDESLNAIEYAQHLKIKHSLEKVNENEILSNVEEHFSFLSEPFGDYSSVPTYLITKKAKKYHTVMLSGDGGDELFFGYPRMLDVLNKRHWFLIPFIIRKPLIKFLNKLSITKTWAPYLYKSLEEWIQAKQLHISPKDLDTFFANTSFSDEIAILFQLPKDMSKRELLFWLRWN
ncbi:MAG: asparagine synthase (glutamine-hydrolyzing), partial [Bacteroidia bacterium]|nr:asparagine synthase (glutamine-hydrolyzing) [Bacteroidia bacterium]